MKPIVQYLPWVDEFRWFCTFQDGSEFVLANIEYCNYNQLQQEQLKPKETFFYKKSTRKYRQNLPKNETSQNRN
eukprot:snap_masked-scaffold_21-processed-gene-4.17-mRNA-1 protein AED:1.00 eAED:1.00 QI:0/0/0/0/1/1/2/0/73